MRPWRVLARIVVMMFRVSQEAFIVVALTVFRPRSARGRLASAPARLCNTLGGALPKLGQILSTRADLVRADVREALAVLREQVDALPPATTAALVERARRDAGLDQVSAVPIAAGSVAQVHLAVQAGGHRRVAVKILRPDISAQLDVDCQIVTLACRTLARWPRFSSVPLVEAVADACATLRRQTDLKQEAVHYRAIRERLRGEPGVIVPEVISAAPDGSLLVLEWLDGLTPISDPQVPADVANRALIAGLRALYALVFEHGLVHCDLHPGNLLVAPDGRAVILDAGLVVPLSETTRRRFAEFFLAIALGDGTTAARVTRESALALPRNLDEARFETDIAELVRTTGGLRAGEFQVLGFVGELFAVMRRHRIYGASEFTMIILALLVYEGVARERFPELDFQQEAVPYVLRGLARPTERGGERV